MRVKNKTDHVNNTFPRQCYIFMNRLPQKNIKKNHVSSANLLQSKTMIGTKNEFLFFFIQPNFKLLKVMKRSYVNEIYFYMV